MPTYQEDYDKVKQLRQKQSDLNKQSGLYGADSSAFGSEVMNSVRAARADRGASMLAQGRGDVMGQMATDPADIRERTANVNPLSVDAITAQARGQNLRTLGTISAFEEDISGTIEGAIQGGTDRLLAAAATKKAEADSANAEAQTLIEQIQLRMEEERLNLEKMRASQSAAGDKSPLEILETIQQGFTREGSPQYSPSGGKGSKSDDGKWEWDGKSWLPVGGQSKANIMGRYDEETLITAMISDPKNRGLYESLLDMGNPDKEDEEKVNSMKFLLDSMENTLSGISTGRLGGPWENVKSFFGDKSLRQFEQQKLLLGPQVAKDIMQLGRLSDEDRKAAEESLPQISDTPEEVKVKIDTLRTILNKSYGDKSDESSQSYSLTGNTR